VTSEWRDAFLGDLIRLQRGHDLTDSQRKAGNVPVMGSAGLNGYHDTSKIKGPGLVIGRSGASFGKIHYSATGYWPHNTALYVTDFLGNDELFTFYYLKGIDFSSYNSGSAQPSLNRNHVYLMPVTIPPLPEQKAIAHILGSLDDKIELNRRMNETLEGMAQALFKSWFMDFDPVIDNALAAGNLIPEEFADRAEVRRQALADGTANRGAAKNFPDSFQETEEMGWVPKGWKVAELPEVVDFLEGPGIRNWQYTDDEDGIKFINIRCIQNGDLKLDTASKLTREEALGKYSHFQLSVDDIVISTSGTLGRYAFVRSEHLPLSLNTSVIRFRKIEGISTLHYIAGYVETALQGELEMRATGSAQLNFGPMHLKQIKMLLPDIQLLDIHNAIAQDLFRKRQENLDGIDTLTKLRDTLLPKLISGEIRVPQAEQMIKDEL